MEYKPWLFGGGPTITPLDSDPSTTPDNPGLGIDLNQPSNRYVGNFSNESYVELDSNPCMHLPTWSVEYSTVVENPINFMRAYGESLSTENLPVLVIGFGSDIDHVNVYMQDLDISVRINHTFTQEVNDGNPHKILVYRIGDDIYCDVDGVVESASMTDREDNFGVPDKVSIGAFAYGSNSKGNFYQGELWDFKKCDQALIPLNEGTGTDIKDSSGTSVGTLVDPEADFWKYYPSNVYLAKYGFNKRAGDRARSTTSYASKVEPLTASFNCIAETTWIQNGTEQYHIIHYGTTSTGNKAFKVGIDASGEVGFYVGNDTTGTGVYAVDGEKVCIESEWDHVNKILSYSVNGSAWEAEAMTPTATQQDGIATIGAFTSVQANGIGNISKLILSEPDGTVIDDISSGFNQTDPTFTSSAGETWTITNTSGEQNLGLWWLPI